MASCKKASCKKAFSKKEIKEAFDLFDKDKNGTIASGELGAAFKGLGLAPTDCEIKNLLKAADKDGSGALDFKEFSELLTAVLDEDEKEMREAFNAFDKDGSGHITKKELKEAMKSMGEKLTDKEVDEMIAAADTDKDDKVCFEEFKKMMAPK